MGTMRSYATISTTPSTTASTTSSADKSGAVSEADATFKSYVASELGVYKQPVEDKDFIDDYMKKNNWQFSPTNAQVLMRKTADEEVTVETNVDPPQHILNSDATEHINFLVTIKRSLVTLKFLCQYPPASPDTFVIDKVTAIDRGMSSTTGIELNPRHLDEAGQDALWHILAARGVTKQMPQVVDIMLNMRDDEAYVSLLKVLAKW